MKPDVRIELQYFPSVYWFALYKSASRVIADDCELFRKQTFRSRMQIQSSNKLLPLIVPVKKGRSKIPAAQVEVDNSTGWQRVHRTTLESAYRSAPYFEYYEHHFTPFFNRPATNLFRLNEQIVQKILQILKWDAGKMIMLSAFKGDTEKCEDWRGKIRPKKNTGHYLPGIRDVEYLQVFSDRFGFMPGLSILDLLFNTGPEAGRILKSMSA